MGEVTSTSGGVPEAGWTPFLGTCVMKDYQHLDITPKVIDFGSSVIQLSHVTRAGLSVQHPLRPAGWALLLVAAGLIGREFFQLGGKFVLPATGSVAVWAACGAAAVGIFSLAYARRSLLIATADGTRLLLPAGDAKFAESVTACIRDAIEAGPNASVKYQIDIAARNIETVSLHEAVPGAGAAAHATIGDVGAGGRHAAMASQRPMGLPSAAIGHAALKNGARVPLSSSLATRQSDPFGATSGSAGSDRDIVRRPDASLERATPLNGVSASSAKPADLASRLATSAAGLYPNSRGDGLRDLTSLMSWVGRSDVQHKEALLDLLRVVEEHEKGGSVSRDDAQAHWRSFADYVQQYLGNMNELPDLTRRTGRSLGLPERGARV